MASQHNHERGPRGRGRGFPAADEPVQAGRPVNREIAALYDQLVAMRLDLVHGVIPRAERITLTSGDLEYVLVQLDAAIAATRGIAGSLDSQATVSIRRDARQDASAVG